MVEKTDNARSGELLGAAAQPRDGSGGRVIAEDGWLFLERAGMGVQCLGRYETEESLPLVFMASGEHGLEA